MNFDDLIGEQHSFYGAFACRFKLGEHLWEAVKHSEGRGESHLESVQEIDAMANLQKDPIARVIVTRTANGYRLIDDSGHLWLELGTDRSDKYFPEFFFRYTPKIVTDTPKEKPLMERVYHFSTNETASDLVLAIGFYITTLAAECTSLDTAFNQLQKGTPLQGDPYQATLQAITLQHSRIEDRISVLESIQKQLARQIQAEKEEQIHV